tara:strand:+ start:210 stop:1424 length:1215 start_codon:yes stop_codon:yes gene_type:complete
MRQYENIFLSYLTFLLVFIIFFLAAVHNSPVNNSMAEWVINYQGGFTRRGLLGEIIFQISQFFDFQLRKTFLALQIFLYICYFYAIYSLFKKIEFNYFFALAIFSPLFFIFSLSELEALGRKDILLFLTFILNFLIFLKFKNLNYNYFYFIITFPLVFLTHEIYIIYVGYFLIFFLFLEKKINLFVILKLLILLIFILFLLDLITSNTFTKDNLELLCKTLKEKSNEGCGLAPHSMIIGISGYQEEVAWKAPHIFRYLMIFIFGFFGLIILIFFSKINQSITNKYISKLNLKFIFFLLFLPSILPFLTAVDSGRYMSMAYTFPCIFYFGLLRINFIILDSQKLELLLERMFLKSKKYKIIFVILLCFTWTPKAVYHEDIGSFPLYRTITKTHYFIDNFKNFNDN